MSVHPCVYLCVCAHECWMYHFYLTFKPCLCVCVCVCVWLCVCVAIYESVCVCVCVGVAGEVKRLF